jgi:hypothetical protein
MSEPTLIAGTEARSLTPSLAGRIGMLALWSGTIFLSAFLLFQVEPILAKIILPWFGGASSVWTTCLMFFQFAYLLGNLYAHWLVRRGSERVQSSIHVALLAVSLFLLPILPAAFWKPAGSEDPTLRILGLLSVTVGLPFLLLSATSPLLQAWFVRHHQQAQPYRFYALSNAGSFLALLSYPVLVEPDFTTRHQAVGWSVAFAAFAVFCAAIAFLRRGRAEPSTPPRARPAARPDWKLQLLWVALAADTSTLLLAVTNHLSQNVAAVPLLWVVPLSLYLLTLILCFEGHGWYRRPFFLRLLAVALGGMAYALAPEFANAGPVLQVPLFCAGLFVCCMVVHGELEKLKPSPEHLTLFYLLVSAGGALGGLFVGVVAPHVFRAFYELPIGLGACAVLVLLVLRRDPSTVFHKRAHPASLLAYGLTAALLVSLSVVARRQGEDARVMVRNFYGMLRVSDLPATSLEPRRRQLMNGTILHGVEFLTAARLSDPTTYFGPRSGAGRALLALRGRPHLRVGIVGLGAGTLASYARSGDRYTFYEINPLVTRLADTQFYFLRDARSRITVVPGDARLSLEREPSQVFDALCVDAFSGDAIPVHLLTREAFLLYLRHLAPQGLLAIHVSNKYLDLPPVVHAAARSLGLSVATVVNPGDQAKEIYTSTWMILSRRPETLEAAGFLPDPPAGAARKLRPWTDDYSNLIEILK